VEASRLLWRGFCCSIARGLSLMYRTAASPHLRPRSRRPLLPRPHLSACVWSLQAIVPILLPALEIPDVVRSHVANRLQKPPRSRNLGSRRDFVLDKQLLWGHLQPQVSEPVTLCHSHSATHTLPLTLCHSHSATHTLPLTLCHSHSASNISASHLATAADASFPLCHRLCVSPRSSTQFSET
jgi:hypothetical protein